MRRRSYLALAGGAIAGLAGCAGDGFPGNDADGSPDSPAGCPDLLDVDRTRCPDDGDGPLAVERSVEVGPAEAWTVRVAVTNRGTRPYGYNPFAWSVFRRREAGWHRFGQAARIQPWAELAPGDRYAWQLSAAGDGPAGAAQRVFIDLEPGQYAFAVPFRGPDRIAAVAPFTIAT